MDGSDEPRPPPAGAAVGADGLEDVPLAVDLLRADLYRILDALVRARAEERDGLVREFEAVWAQLRDATATAH